MKFELLTERFFRSGFRFGIASALAVIGVAFLVVAILLNALDRRHLGAGIDTAIGALWFCTGPLLVVAAVGELFTWIRSRRSQAFLERAVVIAVASWYFSHFEPL
jgi:formate/nitrite transporter FocA (FNT family)